MTTACAAPRAECADLEEEVNIVSRKPLSLAMLLAIGLVITITSCTSSVFTAQPVSPGTRSASGSPAAAGSTAPALTSTPGPTSATIPSGYQRVGGATQGISIAVPASWVVVDLANETVDKAVRKTGLTGISASTLMQSMQAMKKLHALFVVDVKSAVDFATNLNAECLSSGVNETGSAGLSFLRQTMMSQFQQSGAKHITQRDIQIGGVPGVETSYTLSSPAAGTIYAAQLEVLPNPGRACLVTLGATKRQLPETVLAVAAQTAQFPS